MRTSSKVKVGVLAGFCVLFLIMGNYAISFFYYLFFVSLCGGGMVCIKVIADFLQRAADSHPLDSPPSLSAKLSGDTRASEKWRADIRVWAHAEGVQPSHQVGPPNFDLLKKQDSKSGNAPL